MADDAGRLIGARIRELRLEAEITQGELAEKVGSYRPVLARIERGGHRTISLDNIWRYAAALDVEPGLLLCVLDPVWREANGWSPEEVEKWWPRGERRRLKAPCRPPGGRR